MTTTLVNLELRRKDKESFSDTLEALTVRGRTPNQRAENRGRSKSRSRFGNCRLLEISVHFANRIDIKRKIVRSSKRRIS